ncbi:MAG: DUF58 domain-containing protein [Pseudomonadota bacterium]
MRRDAERLASARDAVLLEARRLAANVAVGWHGRRRAGPGETFWQHRAYAAGDPTSLIDWRQSARAADRLYVRQNEWEAAATFWAWRDPSDRLDYAFDPRATTKRRRADVLCAAAALIFAAAGERIGVLGPDARGLSGRAAPARFLEALGVGAGSTPGSTPKSAAAPVPPHGPGRLDGAGVLIVSDFFAGVGAIADSARDLASSGARGVFLQINDPAEEDFPFAGRTQFHDAGRPRPLTFADAEGVAAAYRRRFDARRARVAEIAAGLGWTALTHRTDRPAAPTLAALAAALGERAGR